MYQLHGFYNVQRLGMTSSQSTDEASLDIILTYYGCSYSEPSVNKTVADQSEGRGRS